MYLFCYYHIMRISDKLKERKQGISLEFFPPKSIEGKDAFMKAVKDLKFGETYVNRENFEAMQGFHAGWRKSGIGGADGKHGLMEYLQTHVAYIQF